MCVLHIMVYNRRAATEVIVRISCNNLGYRFYKNINHVHLKLLTSRFIFSRRKKSITCSSKSSWVFSSFPVYVWTLRRQPCQTMILTNSIGHSSATPFYPGKYIANSNTFECSYRYIEHNIECNECNIECSANEYSIHWFSAGWIFILLHLPSTGGFALWTRFHNGTASKA